MRIIDEITNQEIEVANVDLTIGELRDAIWASPEAYATIDDVTKFALDDSDYEQVQIYHVWTDDEIAQKAANEAAQDAQDVIDALPDALADLSELTSDNASDIVVLQDALADLSEIVSGLMQ